MSDPRAANRNNRIAIALAALAGGMLGLAFAAVPLYNLFCSVTGYGGTTQRATAGAERVLDRTVMIRFDANTAGGLGWTFRPEKNMVTVKIGESKLALYEAVNDTDREMTATATFNVSPPSAGAYFNKLQCFCFTEQTLKPGERIDMPVVFFLDPAMVEDADLDEVSTITLSYTFFPVKQKKPDDKPVAGLAGTDNRKPL